MKNLSPIRPVSPPQKPAPGTPLMERGFQEQLDEIMNAFVPKAKPGQQREEKREAKVDQLRSMNLSSSSPANTFLSTGVAKLYKDQESRIEKSGKSR